MKLLLFVLLQSLYTSYAIDCYNCTNVDSISTCHEVAFCPNSKQCFIESKGSGTNTTYTMGCDTSSICIAATTPSTTIVVPSHTLGHMSTDVTGNMSTSTAPHSTAQPVTNNTTDKTAQSGSSVTHSTAQPSINGTTHSITQPIPSVHATTKHTDVNVTVLNTAAKTLGTNGTTGPAPLVGRRELLYTEDLNMFDVPESKISCCSSDTCNKHLLESISKPIVAPTLPETGCHDKPDSNCKLFDDLLHICDNIQKAKGVCKKYCNLCDLVDGNWSEWSNWTSCDVTCGNGTRMRNRSCDDPAPAAGGDNCTGSDVDVEQCTERNCPLDGDWATWASWSACSVTCGIGLQKRARNCSDPFPEADGLFCLGASNDEKICIKDACEDATWLEWSSWGKCSQTCDYGLSTRVRECNISSFIGHSCLGDAHETKLCKQKACQTLSGHTVEVGTWLNWSPWSECSRTCGTGMKTRSRNCTVNLCFGDVHESSLCEVKECKNPISAFLTDGVAESGPENKSIYFKNVITNVGDDYNMSTGQFICRLPGIYSFHISIEKQLDVDQAYCHLMKNGNVTVFVGSRAAFANDGHFQQASNSAVLQLDTGDVIYLGKCSAPNTFTVKSTFSGSLLASEDEDIN